MKDRENQKVRDVYDIDDDWLYEKSEESDYWQNSFDFYNEVAGMRCKYLTEKQVSWLNKIEDACKEDEA